MSRDQFTKLIESIGFETKCGIISYFYKENQIYIAITTYHLHINSEFKGIYIFSNLEPIEDYFKNELRSIKLKQILK